MVVKFKIRGKNADFEELKAQNIIKAISGQTAR